MRSILRQIVAVVALVGITTSMVPAAFAATYTAQAAADKLAASNFIVNQSGSPAAYRLADNLLRQEAVGTAANVLGVLNVPIDDYVCTNKFSDVNAASGWVCRAAELSAAAGLTNSLNATFRPKDNLTRFEALVFALRAAGLVPAGEWNQTQLIALGADNGLISSVAGFNSDASATRGEFFQYVVRGLDASENPELCEILGICPGTGTNPGVSAISVSAGVQPTTNVIVAGQATAPLLAVKLTGNGTVNALVLKRSGISDQNTLSNVYLYDGAARLTDGYSFNTSSEITMNNLGLVVNGSRTIWVLADVYASAPSGQTISVAVTGIRSNAETAVSVANVSGNLFSVASGTTLASIDLNALNSVAAANVNAGTSSYAVFRQAIQVNKRTLHLKAANFRISGSAPSDALENIGLYVDGIRAGSNGMITSANGSNYISFDMIAAPLALNTGSHTLEVRGDISKGSSFSFTVSLQQASDLMVFDPQVGVNVALTATNPGTIPSTAGLITIGSGSFTATQDTEFQAMTNITGGSSNATVAKFKLHAYGEDVKITSLPVIVSLLTASTPVAGGIQNVSLYFNGSQVGSQVSLTTGSVVGAETAYAYTFNLGSQLVIPAGTDSILEVRADLRDSTGANYTAGTVSADLGTATGEGQTSKTSVTGPAVNGNSLTIQTGLLVASKNTGYANQAANLNAAGVKIGSFVLQNQSSSEAVRVTSLTVGLTNDGTTLLTSGTTPKLTNFSGLKTSETSGSGAIPVQPQASNTFSVDFTLAAGATKTIDIYADTGAGTGNVVTTLAISALGASSNTTTSVAAVTGQTIALSTGTLGTPTLTASSTTKAQYIAAAGGASDATKGTFNFVSTGGASTISELKFTVTGTNTVTSVKVGDVSAPVVGNVAWLQGLNIAVPNGGSGASIDALVSYADVGTNGTTPGTTSTVALTYVKSTSGGTTVVSASINVAANTMTLVGSRPTVTVSSTTASGLSIAGVGKIGEVTVSADAKGNIKVNTLVFTVSSSGFSTAPTGVTSAVISDSNSSSSTITNAVCSNGSLVVTCTLDVGANATGFDGYTITAGTSKTFSLFGQLTAAAATGSGTPTISTSVGASTFNWDDASTNGGAGSVNLSGSLIDGFPNASYSIKQ